MSKQTLNAIADAVIERLRGKVIIHRYDAYSTNSIYLKFDYGAAYSLRISDHPGKKHLAYRFNIVESMADSQNKQTTCNHGKLMIFYGPHMINACVRDILNAKVLKRYMSKDYDALVRYLAKNHDHSGFWSGARLV